MHPSTENPSTAVLGRATILMHKMKPNVLTVHYCIITLINQSINQYFIEGRSISNMHGVLNVGTVAFSDNAILGLHEASKTAWKYHVK